MKRLIFFALFVLLIPGLRADEAFFYVAAADGVYRGSIDTDTGKLGALTLASAAKGPGFLALSPDRKSLYATLADSVEAFAVVHDGALARLNEQSAGGAGACHVAVDATGRDVMVADYGGGCIACLRREADGSLGARTALAAFTGSGPDPNRQKKPFAHSVYFDPGDKIVYSCDLGSDHVWIFKFDAERGSLVPDDPPFALVAPGSGPRHLAFGPDGRFVYVASEMGHTVTVFARDAASGALTPVQSIGTLSPGTPGQGVTTAEIACHPTGKWLYVSNRGCETVTQFSIAPDGKLTFVESVASPAKFPRNFALDPSGRWMIVAGQNGNQLAVLKIDSATGRLAATDQVAAVKMPLCVLFFPVK